MMKLFKVSRIGFTKDVNAILKESIMASFLVHKNKPGHLSPPHFKDIDIIESNKICCIDDHELNYIDARNKTSLFLYLLILDCFISDIAK